MKLQSLKLYDFRNYAAAGVQLHPGVNLIVGENAQGKTNLLEAVFYLSTGRSFRTARNQELIRFGAEFADLGCELFSGGREQSIRAVLFSGRKPRQLYIGGVKQRSATALPGVLTTVLFCPDDLLVLKSGAAGRRKLVDTALCQLRPGYAQALGEYQKLYDSKSRILKDYNARPSLLEPLPEFNYRMAQVGAILISYRARYLRELSAQAGQFHAEFSGGKETLRLRYQTVSTVTDPFAEKKTIFQQLLDHQQSHYRAELEYLRQLGIRPLLTIHHFSNPMWFERMGAFSKRENLDDFLSFAKLCADRFGDLVSDWITINEPNVYATNGYFFGDWPPGHKKFAETFTVLENMAYCHIRCYRMLHETREAMGYSDTMVGFANHLRVFEPENPRNPAQAATAKAVEWLFQGAITEAMTTGTFRWPLRNHWKLPKGEYCDFHGVNYYTRSTVTGFADGVRKNSPRNDLGWEIYPEGIVRCAQKLEKLLRRPIWVTENGTCDNQDTFRARYLYEHLEAIVQSGLPFARYYHWCFCDNFEWLEGESARFGLVNVDYATQTRTIKRSGAFYADMIQHGGVTDEAYNTYVRGEVYRIE